MRFEKNQESLINAHQEGLRKMGGLTEYERTDCLTSAVKKWKGLKSIMTEKYDKYLKQLGIIPFPARPGTPEDKGKIEKRIQDVFCLLDVNNRIFKDLTDLQKAVDDILLQQEKVWRCGATGLSVHESFEYEKTYLKPLPEIFPVIPVKESLIKVKNDGTVYFDGNYYQIPDDYRKHHVLCLNTGQEVVIYHDGEEIERHPYLPEAKGMVRLSEQALRNTDISLSDLVRVWGMDVARRQVDIYEEITGGI